MYHGRFSALSVGGEERTRVATTQEEVWLSPQRRTADIHARELGVKEFPGIQRIWSLSGGPDTSRPAVQPAFVARVSFLRLTGKSCLFVLQQMFPLPRRANVIARSFTSMREMLARRSRTPACSVKSHCFSETTRLKKDWNHQEKLILKFPVDHSRIVRLR